MKHFLFKFLLWWKLSIFLVPTLFTVLVECILSICLAHFVQTNLSFSCSLKWYFYQIKPIDYKIKFYMTAKSLYQNFFFNLTVSVRFLIPQFPFLAVIHSIFLKESPYLPFVISFNSPKYNCIPLHDVVFRWCATDTHRWVLLQSRNPE